MKWDDLNILLAVQRGGGLAGAARRLGVDKTTVARRLRALESDFGAPVTQADGKNRIRLTPDGIRLAHHAERMEAEMTAALDPRNACSASAGLIRITAVPIVMNHILLPNLPALQADLPDAEIELISEARDLDLAQREADLALRLARPRSGGTEVITRKLGELRYALFRHAAAPDDLPWIGYDPAMGHLSHAAAIDRLAETAPGLRVNDAETLLQAVSQGLGKSLLPQAIAATCPDLICDTQINAPRREVWLMMPRKVKGVARFDRAAAWLSGLF